MSVAGLSFETATSRGGLEIECVLQVLVIRAWIDEMLDSNVDARDGSMRRTGMPESGVGAGLLGSCVDMVG